MGQGDRLSGIQMLRGLAAMAVVLHHALEEATAAPGLTMAPDWLIRIGAAGVDIFFVISGFIMVYCALPNGRPADRPLGFFARRTARIYPLYWICCIPMALVGLSAGIPLDHATILTSITLQPHAGNIIWIAWTLVYEVYFYALFALALNLQRRALVIPCVMASIGLGYLLHPLLPAGAWRGFLGNPILFEFCLGMMLGWWHAVRPLSTRARQLCGALGLALLLVATLLIPSPDTHALPGWSRTIGWGIPALLIVASLSGTTPSAIARTRISALLGDASYAIYLTHSLVMIAYYQMLVRMTGIVPHMLLLGVAILTSALVGILTHRAIEQPIMRRLRPRGAAIRHRNVDPPAQGDAVAPA